MIPRFARATALTLLCCAPAGARAPCPDAREAEPIIAATMPIPEGDEQNFAAHIRRFSLVSGMTLFEIEPTKSVAGAASAGPRYFVFRSPRRSVSLSIKTDRETALAAVELTRLCNVDADEDWRLYWENFKRFLDFEGYELKLEALPSK